MSYIEDHINDWYYEDYIERQYETMNKKSSTNIFTRGYKECRERLSKNSQFSRSCFNCKPYFQASGDKEEVCQNESVLSYDMVIVENQIYCVKWQPSSTPDESTSIFKKSGRARLD